MIISHQFRYLFLEMPLTASWAIHHELCQHYGGEPVLHKHASYSEFRQIASASEKNYFVFATIRNPLDTVVSQYYKLKTNHRGAFSKPESAQNLLVDYSDLDKYRFIKENDASFTDFFREYYRRPYSDLIDYSAHALDFVIRYEHLQEDFAEVLRRLNLKQAQPIPPTNKTQGKKGQWQDYYTPEIQEQAKQVFGPFMACWGYTFPEAWGPYQVSRLNVLRYQGFNLLRGIYVNRFKYSRSPLASMVRSLRARFK